MKKLIGSMTRKRASHIAKSGKKAVGIIATLAVFIIIVNVLNYVYMTDDAWCRILWHHFYEDQGKIDNVYLGSSHVYCNIDPYVLDELNGEYNFNLASPAQSLKGSYYLLKEAGQRNDLSHVYLEMYYEPNVKDNDESERVDTVYWNNWCNTDYMRMSANKVGFMLSIDGAERYIDILFPFCRYRGKLWDWKYIKSVVEEKREDSYRAYQCLVDHADGNGYDTYQGKGHLTSTRVYKEQDRCHSQEYALGERSLGESSRRYFSEIVKYCQERGIPITVFISPVSDLQLVCTGNYDNYINEVSAMAAEAGVPFYDFNLAKEEYLPLQYIDHFMDIDHLNSAGAALFTPFFYQVISGDEAENEKYFYHSYAEKLSETTPAVYGLYIDQEQAAEISDEFWNVYVVSNRNTGMEYRIILTPEEGEQYMVQDFDANKEFKVPKEEHGICTIVARMEEVTDEVNTMEIKY